MNCPACRTATLVTHALLPDLSGRSCPACGGVFILSTTYWEWRDRHPGDEPEQPSLEPDPLEPESRRARQCPHCQHLLLPYRIAVAIPFTIDHCDACNSIWLDRGEWEALQRRNLHDNLHQFFAPPWQRRLRLAQHRAAMEAIYADKFGAEGYAEARRVRAWIDAHPQSAALRAYLNARDPYDADRG